MMTAMDPFRTLLSQHPLVFVHLVSAVAALVIGAVVMLRRKGNTAHRWLGWSWVAAMAVTTVSSAFILDRDMPNLAGFTPIHAFTVVVAVGLPRAIMKIRRGDVQGHRAMMRGLFFGACVVAGLFTLLPGRFLGRLLWGSWLGLVA